MRRVVVLLCAFIPLLFGACSSSSGSDSPDAAPTDEPDGPVNVDPVPDAGVDAVPPDTRARKVLVIGIGGLRFDKLPLANTPALTALADRGIMARTWMPSAPMADTRSGPGWATIATGVWPDKHGVVNDDFRNHKLVAFPDVFTRLEAANPALRTLVIGDFKPLTESPGPIFSTALDIRVSHEGGGTSGGWPAADTRTTTEAAAFLSGQNPDAAFVYLGNVNATGESGVDVAYLSAITRADKQVGDLVAAINGRATYAQENWLVIVTTGHGRWDSGSTGGNTWQERQSFIIAAGGDVAHAPLATEARAVDIAPTILAHFGIAVKADWSLDGVALGTAKPDVFDSLASKLKPAVDEQIPVLGWTHESPAGWSIDNSNLTSGGTTEWQGWSFVSTDFWNLVEIGQWREAFVRSRGVIAVADNDEWNDVGNPSERGTFDSTLHAPPVDVKGGTTVHVRFASHFRRENDMKGQMLVAFDDGAYYPYLKYGSSSSDSNHDQDVVSKIEDVPVQVPSGAKKMLVAWRLFDARNNYYWALDDFRIE